MEQQNQRKGYKTIAECDQARRYAWRCYFDEQRKRQAEKRGLLLKLLKANITRYNDLVYVKQTLKSNGLECPPEIKERSKKLKSKIVCPNPECGCALKAEKVHICDRDHLTCQDCSSDKCYVCQEEENEQDEDNEAKEE